MFRCYDVQAIYCTDTIQFIPSTISQYPMQVFDRVVRLSQIRQNTNFSKVNIITLVPEDFDLKTSNGNNALNNIFNKLKIILSYVYISDYADLDESSLIIKMNGYRSIEKTINLNTYEYKTNHVELYKIYIWIYSGGNSCDKMQLAKNIISLHCKYSDILDIDGRTFSSIKANYELYLKSSVDKYLQTKKEYTTFLLDIIEKINNEVSTYFTSIKKNMVAILTYIIGIVVSNAFSNKKFNNIFTKDITTITSFIILGSFVFSVINIIETYSKYLRYIGRISKIKESYGDILDEYELNEILNKTLDLEKTKTDFKNGIKALSITWFIMILGMLAILDYLSNYKVLLIFNLFK
ncbi:hypothetical protein KPL37_07010 [Clostridium frigoris]|uniref:Uncharacterized protein n=1 Tax=Clostridium frigoris TaxID=205327 RepID=A0ABS6BU40_9CLOT|nr:hypothetical protein [Clostridium frigoris]MBU3159504.1 hypothetical protein [Clostridium frigoris]